jgi:hypothetical protein
MSVVAYVLAVHRVRALAAAPRRVERMPSFVKPPKRVREHGP